MHAPRGYTHVVETTGPSRTISVSGQVGITADGKVAGNAGDFRTQAVQSFENLKAALAAVGAGFEHVVKITSSFVDISRLPVFIEVRDRYVDTKAPPRTSPMKVQRWARKRHPFPLPCIQATGVG